MPLRAFQGRHLISALFLSRLFLGLSIENGSRSSIFFSFLFFFSRFRVGRTRGAQRVDRFEWLTAAISDDDSISGSLRTHWDQSALEMEKIFNFPSFHRVSSASIECYRVFLPSFTKKHKVAIGFCFLIINERSGTSTKVLSSMASKLWSTELYRVFSTKQKNNETTALFQNQDLTEFRPSFQLVPRPFLEA